MELATCVTLTRYFYPATERPDALLLPQLDAAQERVIALVASPLFAWQLDALTCLVSDLDAGLVSARSTTFEASFLLTALNKELFQLAAAEFHLFCYVQGKMHTRAWQKRRAEVLLFSTGRLLFQ
jgi:GH24 family phage-related lysozyme (muramidase)